MRDIIIIMVSMVLVNNLVLVQGLGICPTIKLSVNARRSVSLGFFVGLGMVASTAVTWPIDKYLLKPYDLEYFRILIFVPLVCLVGYLIVKLVHKVIPTFCMGVGCLNSLLMTNCAVVGIALLNVQKEYTYLQALMAAVGAGIGFVLVMVLFAGMRHRIDRTKGIPQAFQGIPVYLAAAAMLSVVLIGFSSVAVGIFA
jgi:Na+-translocating ferredoxin:NAD+ oxidoreductase subunit A